MPDIDPTILRRIAEERFETLHYSAIGQIAVKWAFLENEIDSACAALADVSPVTAICFTSQVIGPVRKLDALCAIVNELEVPKPLKRRLTKLHELIRVGGRKAEQIYSRSMVI